jgi:hypothetical protein
MTIFASWGGAMQKGKPEMNCILDLLLDANKISWLLLLPSETGATMAMALIEPYHYWFIKIGQ